MKTNNAVELLAPCGSWESLMAAIQAGADSVYFGVEHLNMRARSSFNFSMEDLEKIAAIAKEHGIRTYLTINTVLYDHDLNLMRSIVKKASEVGIDAIIASDVAVLHYAKELKMPVHISTQANVTNIETVEFYAQFADVVVLARELTLEMMADIIKNIKRRKIKGPSGKLVKVELFVHGALCMAVSGKCYLSLHSHFASANRGACVQNCRRPYLVTDKKEGHVFEIDNEYIMSAKDLCTIHIIKQLLDTQVGIMKIEGRGRDVEYVYTTTQCYREAIDAYRENSLTEKKIEVWKERLSSVFNRGFFEGYYLGREMGEWADGNSSKATLKKVYIGKGVKFFDHIGIGEFKVESHTLHVGDKIIITGPTTGIIEQEVTEMRVDQGKVKQVKKGENFSMPVERKIRPSDKLYKMTPVHV